MVKVLINCVFTVAAIAAYDFIKVDEVGQPVAVANYDAVFTALEAQGDKDLINRTMEELQKDASKLSAAGFVVIDSRALLGYPASTEIPVRSPEPVLAEEPSKEDVLKGSEVDAGFFDEK